MCVELVPCLIEIPRHFEDVTRGPTATWGRFHLSMVHYFCEMVET